jgi:hypothetical protein
VDDSYISIATISGGSLNAMTNVQTAPRMSAGVFSRSLNFFNGAGQYEGLNAMSQPDTNVQLFSGDTGLVGRTYAVRSYGVSVPTLKVADIVLAEVAVACAVVQPDLQGAFNSQAHRHSVACCSLLWYELQHQLCKPALPCHLLAC